ncbi:MAG: serine protease [Candidatus Paceibacterota bacterium]
MFLTLSLRLLFLIVGLITAGSFIPAKTTVLNTQGEPLLPAIELDLTKKPDGKEANEEMEEKADSKTKTLTQNDSERETQKNPDEPKETGAAQKSKETIILELIPFPRAQTSEVSFSEINEDIRSSLVNILCRNTSGSVGAVSGSGIFIDERGVILTNAHLAQFLLLSEDPKGSSISCTIRTGSPAQNTYRARILYISPNWVATNAHQIASENPTGTGENDFALLLVTEAIGTNEIPSSFPAHSLSIESTRITEGDNVLAAAYPAGFLGSISVNKNLFAASSVTKIEELFTFEGQTLDLLSLGSTIIAQAGSSGGAVVSNENKVIGLIVTSTSEETTDARILRAITIGHINRALLKETNVPLSGYLQGNLEVRANSFAQEIAPQLRELLYLNI